MPIPFSTADTAGLISAALRAGDAASGALFSAQRVSDRFFAQDAARQQIQIDQAKLRIEQRRIEAQTRIEQRRISVAERQLNSDIEIARARQALADRELTQAATLSQNEINAAAANTEALIAGRTDVANIGAQATRDANNLQATIAREQIVGRQSVADANRASALEVARENSRGDTEAQRIRSGAALASQILTNREDLPDQVVQDAEAVTRILQEGGDARTLQASEEAALRGLQGYVLQNAQSLQGQGINVQDFISRGTAESANDLTAAIRGLNNPNATAISGPGGITQSRADQNILNQSARLDEINRQNLTTGPGSTGIQQSGLGLYRDAINNDNTGVLAGFASRLGDNDFDANGNFVRTLYDADGQPINPNGFPGDFPRFSGSRDQYLFDILNFLGQNSDRYRLEP